MLAMMGSPQMTIVGVLILLVAVSAGATGNPTSSPSAAAAGNTTASPHKNTTAPSPLPPFGTNHAVGEAAGWFFDWKANASATNYSAWAANRTFYLGDYLSFKTDTGNTVVHTTNATMYRSCRASVAANGSSSGWKPEAAFLAVMLTNEGTNYFFSDAWDGDHCRKGMRFEVTVAHGRGLPSVPPSYYEPLSGAPAAQTTEGRVVAMWAATIAAAAVVTFLL